ncbi:MAG: tetratricopeptide repeat protein [Pirellulales bacterium]|nr:tetratricopeptide repeat protein [Pirellulales bacterium]
MSSSIHRMIWQAALVVACGGTLAHAADVVRKADGKSVSGEIVRTSASEVVVSRSGGTEETIPVVEIEEIQLDREPAPLRQARNDLRNGNYPRVLESLDKLRGGSQDRPLMQQEVQFYRALATSRLALAGTGDANAALKLLTDFLKSYKGSWRYMLANELAGDLLVSLDRQAEALTYYQELEKSPYPAHQMRARVAQGRALIVQGKHAEALAQFEKVLAMPDNQADTRSSQERLGATLGKALVLAETGDVNTAVQLVEQAIAALDPENNDLNAQAYLTLGTCYRKKGDSRAAEWAFLWVDLIYSANPQFHAQALANLKEVFAENGKPERALQAENVLKERYGNTKWARVGTG